MTRTNFGKSIIIFWKCINAHSTPTAKPSPPGLVPRPVTVEGGTVVIISGFFEVNSFFLLGGFPIKIESQIKKSQHLSFYYINRSIFCVFGPTLVNFGAILNMKLYYKGLKLNVNFAYIMFLRVIWVIVIKIDCFFIETYCTHCLVNHPKVPSPFNFAKICINDAMCEILVTLFYELLGKNVSVWQE